MAIKMVSYKSTPYGEIRGFVCTATEDVANLPISTTVLNRCDATSTAYIESTGDTYFLSQADTWELDKSGTIIVFNTTSLAHTTVTIGVASGVALAANANRTSALFINDSDTTIYLKVGAAAVLNEGIRLNTNGSSYEMSKNYGNLDTRAIYAISSAATKKLLITEGS